MKDASTQFPLVPDVIQRRIGHTEISREETHLANFAFIHQSLHQRVLRVIAKHEAFHQAHTVFAAVLNHARGNRFSWERWFLAENMLFLLGSLARPFFVKRTGSRN